MTEEKTTEIDNPPAPVVRDRPDATKPILIEYAINGTKQQLNQTTIHNINAIQSIRPAIDISEIKFTADTN